MSKNDFEKVVKEVQSYLKKNEKEWKERYSCYAKAIEENLPIIEKLRKKFYQFTPLRFYITTCCLKEKNAVFSVRYLGQIVAKLSVKGENITLSTKDYEKNNIKKYGCNISVNNENWRGKCATDFRKYFSNHYKNNIKRNDEGKRNEEHRIESLLLTEFSKRKSKSKSLTGIQPVKFANAYFPMPTPISASDHKKINYSADNGGGIDIFARVGKSPTTKLCVIEVKDETVSQEPPIEAVKQAVAYATFIRELLRYNPTWYKLFGFSGKLPKSLTILASCAMPYNEDLYDTSFDGQIIDIDGDKIELHYIYFEENNNIITKIDSSINKNCQRINNA